MRKLFTTDEFRGAARDGVTPDGSVIRLAPSVEPKLVDEAKRKIRFVFSDGAIDRAGDSIDADGWVIDSYLKNPVVPWAHDTFSPPIGRSSELTSDGNRLTGVVEFAPPDVNAFADTIFRMVKAGYINAGSVGFLPIEWSFSNDKGRPFGIDFTKQELLEFSICPVPCNPNALAEARSKGIDTEPLRLWAERVLDTGASVLVPRDLLEETFRQAKTPRTVRQRYLRPSTKAEDWKCGAARDLPLDDADGWDGSAAEASIFTHAGGDDFDPAVARKGFLAYDSAAPKLRGSYKLPFARVKDGKLVAAKGGVHAAASRLSNTDISESAKAEAKGVVDHYETRFKDGKSMGEGTNAAGAVTVPLGNCGRAEDAECGMKDPVECSVHAPKDNGKRRTKSGRVLSTVNERDLRAAADHHRHAAALHKDAMGMHGVAAEHHEKAAGLVGDVLARHDAAHDGDGDDDGPPSDGGTGAETHPIALSGIESARQTLAETREAMKRDELVPN